MYPSSYPIAASNPVTRKGGGGGVLQYVLGSALVYGNVREGVSLSYAAHVKHMPKFSCHVRLLRGYGM